MLYNFKLSHDTTEATKNICWTKGKDTVDHGTVTRWMKKFCSGCKNLDNQASSGKPKIMDCEVALQAIEVNPMSNTLKVSDKLDTFTTFAKASWAAELCLSCTSKILQNFWLILVFIK